MSFAVTRLVMKNLLCILSLLLCGAAWLPITAYAQNFDETWKEFLENDKVSNVSALHRPDKRFDKENYIKYLLINTNNEFCGSEVNKAELLVDEILTFGPEVQDAVPGYTGKFKGLQTQIASYYTVDSLWRQFLVDDQVKIEDLERVERASKLCEKETAAKLTYMSAYNYLCLGDMSKAADIFENRTLKLAEKTSLKIEDVEGLPARVSKMKSFFQAMPKLEQAWQEYVATGVSPGVEVSLPPFLCNIEPKIKELVLKGLHDPCEVGRSSLSNIDELLTRAGAVSTIEFENGVDELRELVEQTETNLDNLNREWTAFVDSGEVDVSITYTYQFCETEPLIQAYLLDGFSFVCGLAESNLETIDSLRRRTKVPLSKETKDKIKELKEVREEYRQNGTDIEAIWLLFVANDDHLLADYNSTDQYCDHVQEVKDWTMRGLTQDCEGGLNYLEQIEAFNEKFDFKFYAVLECRIQKLRIKIYDCRFSMIDELAKLEAEGSSYDERLGELMEEYGMGERPLECQEAE